MHDLGDVQELASDCIILEERIIPSFQSHEGSSRPSSRETANQEPLLDVARRGRDILCGLHLQINELITQM